MGQTKSGVWLVSITLMLVLAIAATLRLYRIDSLPSPSLNYDEAYYAVDAIHVLEGKHAIFFPGNNGHEPLYVYLEAGMFRLFGISAVTVRVLSALLGIATVAAVFWAGSEIFAFDSATNLAVGLLSALALAGLFWHISYSRGGLRVISFPLLESLTMAAVARSLRKRRMTWFIGAGVLLGVSLYTYSIVRLLPFVVVAGFVLWGLGTSRNRPALVWGFGVVASVAFLVFLPLGVYFIQHPWTFTGRAEVLWDPTRPLEKAVATAGMFIFRGDQDGSINIPGRPALDGFQASIAGVGLLTCLVQSPRHRGWLVLVWLGTMLFANVTGDDPASFLHGLGAVPALALMMGVGLETGVGFVARSLRPLSAKTLPGLVVLGLISSGLAWSASKTFTDYFQRWPKSTDLALAFQEDLSAIGDFIRDLPADESVYVSPFADEPPTLVFAMRGADSHVKVYDGRGCTVLKNAPYKPLTYVVILSDANTLPLLQTSLPGGQLAQNRHFSSYRVTATTPIAMQPQHPAEAVFGQQIQLDGYDAHLRSQAGRSFLDLTFYWRALQPIPEPYTVFVHLVSGQGALEAQYDATPCVGSYRTERWSPDEIIVDRYTMPLPEQLSSGTYRLRAGLYHSYEYTRLEVRTDLDTVDNVVILPGPVQIGVSP